MPRRVVPSDHYVSPPDARTEGTDPKAPRARTTRSAASQNADASLVAPVQETYEQWNTRMMLQCSACPHRLIGHNSEEHPTMPFACRSCGCKRFKLSKVVAR